MVEASGHTSGHVLYGIIHIVDDHSDKTNILKVDLQSNSCIRLRYRNDIYNKVEVKDKLCELLDTLTEKGLGGDVSISLKCVVEAIREQKYWGNCMIRTKYYDVYTDEEMLDNTKFEITLYNGAINMRSIVGNVDKYVDNFLTDYIRRKNV